MQLDLVAIAKGFITDQVAEVLKENDVTTAIIDLGGNIYVMGNNPSRKDWTVGIQDPFAPRGETIARNVLEQVGLNPDILTTIFVIWWSKKTCSDRGNFSYGA